MNAESLVVALVSLAETVETCERSDDAGERSRLAVVIAERCAEVARAVAETRDDTAATMAESMSLAEIGATLGVSRQRAHQLVARARARRRAEWGTEGIAVRRVTSIRDDFGDYCQSQLEAAEAACKGYLVTREGESKQVDGRGFYSAHGRRLHPRWASDELREHWEIVGKPLTWTQWQSQSRERAA